MSRRTWVLVLAVGIVGLLAGCSSSLTDSQAQLKPQDYGKGAQYQVEISLNCTSAQNCTLQNVIGQGKGFGIWLWLELNGGGTGDYTGSDCGHNLPGDPVKAGAFAASGDLTWTDDGNGHLIISGVTLIGGAAPVRITVPSKLGHYMNDGYLADGTPLFQVTDPNSPFWGFHFDGSTQLQIAP